jgi:hypothetical protein
MCKKDWKLQVQSNIKQLFFRSFRTCHEDPVLTIMKLDILLKDNFMNYKSKHHYAKSCLLRLDLGLGY